MNKHRARLARTALILAPLCALVRLTPACGGAPAPSSSPAPPATASVAVAPATASAPAAPASAAAPAHDDGIGLGNFSGFDAGPDAHWVAVDAAMFRNTKVNGRLPPEVIQKVVRANFGSFRTCYEKSLRTSPNLTGRVNVKFVIGLDGHVTSAADEKSEIPDREVVQCVVDGVRKLQFPKPEGGIVTVVYPIIFSPGD